MNKPSILIADDDRDILNTYQFLLSDDYNISTANSVQEAKKILINDEIQVAVIDLNFEGQLEDGISLIDFIQDQKPHVSLIVLSSDNDTKRVVEAMRRPLIDFVMKDEDSEASLRSAIKQSLVKKKPESNDAHFKFESESLLIKRLLLRVDQVLMSQSMAPILILGESGTGKEFLAKYISSKLNKKLVAANMASIPKETAESELFGHMKGAFTGAFANKAGLLEQAHNGVFFLDEIGDCSSSIQSKLLRVIQEKEILPVGGLSPKKINLRFLAATHQDLETMIAYGEFRLDLYQRLNTFTFQIPPLRERPEDIVFYTRKFINELTKDSYFRIEDEGLEILKAYHWPGNVRELRNIIERIVVFSRRKCLDHEVALLALSKIGSNIEKTSQEKIYTKDEIIEALKKTNGNRQRAADLLHVHKTTLHRWIKRFSIGDIIGATSGRPRLEVR